jgi:hypothetical protein
MQDPPTGHYRHSRWQYVVLWRYGALLLAAVGLLAMGFGAAGVCGTAISASLLPLGFISLIAGVVLPRIEGKFTAGPSGLTAEMLAVHQLDAYGYAVYGPAFADRQTSPAMATGPESGVEPTPREEQIALGDVWDALMASGVEPRAVAGGHAYFYLPDGRQLVVPNHTFADWGIASDELLAVLASWGVRPTASGKYPFPDRGDPAKEGTIFGRLMPRAF